MSSKSSSRREFIRKSGTVAGLMSVGGVLPGFTAESYRRIHGANETIRVSIMGVNSRGNALARNFAAQDRCQVTHICDVDSRAIAKCIDGLKERQEHTPETVTDFRESLEDSNVDALVIAAPDHWHAPASLLALQAGKHVYVEKPCSHNPREGEMLVQAQKHYKKVVQMGNQRRSWPNVMEGIAAVQAGEIGRVYFGKSWYTNNRQSIGIGKATEVPDWLDWDLWQGPAPRQAFKDNIVHYNWHWLWHWGTGEALNNGTHMIDLLRWGMQVEYPTRVSSNGGRYRYQDDWEAPDTQVINLDFGDDMTMTWEGRSCNGKAIEGSAVGVVFYGEKGSLLIPGGDSYTIFDLKGKISKHVDAKLKIDPRNTTNPAEQLDALHINNFFDGITQGTDQRSDIYGGHQSTLLMQLGNISQRTGRSLTINPYNGHIMDDDEANTFWSRSYEPGWEMKL